MLQFNDSVFCFEIDIFSQSQNKSVNIPFSVIQNIVINKVKKNLLKTKPRGLFSRRP